MTEEEQKEFNLALKKMKISFSVIILLLLISFITYKCNNDNSKLTKTIVNDNQVTFKDKDSLNHTKNNVIEGNTKEFIDLQVKDKEINELQELVKKYKKQLYNKGNATNFTSETKVNNSFSIKKDTVETKIINNDTIKLHKYIYDINLKDNKGVEWITGNAVATKDSLHLQQKIINKYSVIIGEESQGWFKPKKPFVEVINLNPFSETTKVKTYQVETKPVKKIGIGPGIYYGIRNSFQSQVFIGVGVQYNLIRF